MSSNCPSIIVQERNINVLSLFFSILFLIAVPVLTKYFQTRYEWKVNKNILLVSALIIGFIPFLLVINRKKNVVKYTGPCGGCICSSGTTCIGGKCVSSQPKFGYPCLQLSGSREGGGCPPVPVLCDPSLPCSSDQESCQKTCTGGACGDIYPMGYCKEGESCQILGGKNICAPCQECSRQCPSGACPEPGKSCIGGTCSCGDCSHTCQDGSCPGGQKCIGGRCDCGVCSSSCQDGTCLNGKICQGGICIDNNLPATGWYTWQITVSDPNGKYYTWYFMKLLNYAGNNFDVFIANIDGANPATFFIDAENQTIQDEKKNLLGTTLYENRTLLTVGNGTLPAKFLLQDGILKLSSSPDNVLLIIPGAMPIGILEKPDGTTYTVTSKFIPTSPP